MTSCLFCRVIESTEGGEMSEQQSETQGGGQGGGGQGGGGQGGGDEDQGV
jgi:hypothetical protein